MNKWQMSGRSMPERWRGVEYDIPSSGQKAHLQHSIHPMGQKTKKGNNNNVKG